ncbi:MAG TPA: hypothetical protein VFA26_20520, partial [Gemmataceae bacterium]|nr:hypothetical protein [Gemmataceae bacterium]
MNLRNTYILFGVAAAVLAAFAVYLLVGSSAGDRSQYVLPELHKKGHEVKAEAIDRLVIDNKSSGTVLAFAKVGDEWRV